MKECSVGNIKIDPTITGVAFVAAVAAAVAFLSFLITLGKERSSLRQAEIAMRAALLKQMAEATAALVADCRLIVARRAENKRSAAAGTQEVPDFRQARRDWLIADTGIRVQLAAYLTHWGSRDARKGWTQLSKILNYYNLITSPDEPARSKFVEEIISFANSANRGYLEGIDLEALHDPDDNEYEQTYYRVGAALIDAMLPVAQKIVRARRSPIYRFKFF
jgi:hypothetical protein